ncbi:bZIP transcription factor JlbA/IDI-4 [Aspergillus foveolatus]|uniref:bZIP transcription factor JlbA/IDI-4 n=1 Tax=Aspergillus foveolatus TaxID=210207 RepID=UPI003CCDC2FE
MAAATISAASVARQITAYLDISPHSFSDSDFLLSSNSSLSSSSTPALFPDLSAAFPPVDLDPNAPQLFYDPLLVPSVFPGDPVSSSGFDQFTDLTAAAGYPSITTTTADDIDWTALGCLPQSEHPANSLGSQSQGLTPSIDSPDPTFNYTQPTILTTDLSTTHITTTKPIQSQPMPSATSLSTPSSESSPKEKEHLSRITKRQLNTLAARRYRQRKLDKVAQLEEELAAVKRERDELKMRVSKLEGETEVLRSMVKDKN